MTLSNPFRSPAGTSCTRRSAPAPMSRTIFSSSSSRARVSRVKQVVGLAALVVFPRGSIGVPVAQIDLAGGHAVAHHFAHIAQGHLHAGKAGFRGAIIDPVFEVMLVAPLVVEPRGGVARLRAPPHWGCGRPDNRCTRG